MNPLDLLKLAMDHLKACEQTLEMARRHLPPDDQALASWEIGAHRATSLALHSCEMVRRDARLAIQLHEKATKTPMELKL